MNQNLKKLQDCFVDSLNIAASLVRDELTYGSISEWDSVAHMALVAQIESSFDVMLDTDEIIDMSSFAVAKTILQKHGISFE